MSSPSLPTSSGLSAHLHLRIDRRKAVFPGDRCVLIEEKWLGGRDSNPDKQIQSLQRAPRAEFG